MTRIGTQRTWIAAHHGFAGVRAFGWQIDLRDWLPFSVREGWASDWTVIRVGRSRWVTLGRVR